MCALFSVSCSTLPYPNTEEDVMKPNCVGVWEEVGSGGRLAGWRSRDRMRARGYERDKTSILLTPFPSHWLWICSSWDKIQISLLQSLHVLKEMNKSHCGIMPINRSDSTQMLQSISKDKLGQNIFYSSIDYMPYYIDSLCKWIYCDF